MTGPFPQGPLPYSRRDERPQRKAGAGTGAGASAAPTSSHGNASSSYRTGPSGAGMGAGSGSGPGPDSSAGAGWSGTNPGAEPGAGAGAGSGSGPFQTPSGSQSHAPLPGPHPLQSSSSSSSSALPRVMKPSPPQRYAPRGRGIARRPRPASPGENIGFRRGGPPLASSTPLLPPPPPPPSSHNHGPRVQHYGSSTHPGGGRGGYGPSPRRGSGFQHRGGHHPRGGPQFGRGHPRSYGGGYRHHGPSHHSHYRGPPHSGPGGSNPPGPKRLTPPHSANHAPPHTRGPPSFHRGKSGPDPHSPGPGGPRLGPLPRSRPPSSSFVSSYASSLSPRAPRASHGSSPPKQAHQRSPQASPQPLSRQSSQYASRQSSQQPQKPSPRPSPGLATKPQPRSAPASSPSLPSSSALSQASSPTTHDRLYSHKEKRRGPSPPGRIPERGQTVSTSASDTKLSEGDYTAGKDPAFAGNKHRNHDRNNSQGNASADGTPQSGRDRDRPENEHDTEKPSNNSEDVAEAIAPDPPPVTVDELVQKIRSANESIGDVDERIARLCDEIRGLHATKNAKSEGLPVDPVDLVGGNGDARSALQIAAVQSKEALFSTPLQRVLSEAEENIARILMRNRACASAAQAALRHLCFNPERGLDPSYVENVHISLDSSTELAAKVQRVLKSQKEARLRERKMEAKKYAELMTAWKRRTKLARGRRSREKREQSRERDRFLFRSIMGESGHLRAKTSSGRTTTRLVGTSTLTSHADTTADIDASLAEIESEGGTPGARNTWSRTLAVIPEQDPTMVIPDCGSVLIEDPIAEHYGNSAVNPWTREEVLIFLEKYVSYHKNFRKIASFLDYKTAGDVVQFYYKNKLVLNLKQLTLKRKSSKRVNLNALAGLLPQVMAAPRERMMAIDSTTKASEGDADNAAPERDEPRLAGVESGTGSGRARAPTRGSARESRSKGAREGAQQSPKIEAKGDRTRSPTTRRRDSAGLAEAPGRDGARASRSHATESEDEACGSAPHAANGVKAENVILEEPVEAKTIRANGPSLRKGAAKKNEASTSLDQMRRKNSAGDGYATAQLSNGGDSNGPTTTQGDRKSPTVTSPESKGLTNHKDTTARSRPSQSPRLRRAVPGVETAKHERKTGAHAADSPRLRSGGRLKTRLSDGDSTAPADGPVRTGAVKKTKNADATVAKDEKKLKVAKWTAMEEDMFHKYFAEHGRNWRTIASLMSTKTPEQVKGYWKRMASTADSGSKSTRATNTETLTLPPSTAPQPQAACSRESSEDADRKATFHPKKAYSKSLEARKFIRASPAIPEDAAGVAAKDPKTDADSANGNGPTPSSSVDGAGADGVPKKAAVGANGGKNRTADLTRNADDDADSKAARRAPPSPPLLGKRKAGHAGLEGKDLGPAKREKSLSSAERSRESDARDGASDMRAGTNRGTPISGDGSSDTSGLPKRHGSARSSDPGVGTPRGRPSTPLSNRHEKSGPGSARAATAGGTPRADRAAARSDSALPTLSLPRFRSVPPAATAPSSAPLVSGGRAGMPAIRSQSLQQMSTPVPVSPAPTRVPRSAPVVSPRVFPSSAAAAASAASGGRAMRLQDIVNRAKAAGFANPDSRAAPPRITGSLELGAAPPERAPGSATPGSRRPAQTDKRSS